MKSSSNKLFLKNALPVCFVIFGCMEMLQARISGVRSQQSSSSTNSSIEGGSTAVSTPIDNTGIVGTGVALEECSYDQSKSQHFPLSFFREISRSGEDVAVEVKDTRILVNIPPVLRVCGKFIPDFLENPDTRNVTIAMKLISEDGRPLTYGDFEKCLVDKKLLTDGKLEHDKIPGGNYSSQPYEWVTGFNKKKDGEKTATVSFAYPVAFNDPQNGYPPRYVDGVLKGIKVPSSKCLVAEKVGERNLYLNKGKDILLDEFAHVCKYGSVEEIQDLKKSLANFPELQGVVGDLELQLTSAELDKIWEGRAKEIFKEMANIEESLRKYKKDGDLDEASVSKKVTRYSSLVEELNKILIQPGIDHLNALLIKRETLEDPSPELKSLDELIKKLNEYIGEYALAKLTPGRMGSGDVFETAKKLGLISQGSAISTIHYKSFHYSKVYEGEEDERGKKLTLEQAEERLKKEYNKGKKILEEDYQVKTVRDGSTMPLRVTEKAYMDMARNRQKAEIDYQRQEAKMMQDACGADFFGRQKNPSRCQYIQRTAPRRQALARRRLERMDHNIGRLGSKLDKLRTARSDYETKRDESRDDYDSDSYYSDLDDSSFNDDYYYSGSAGYSPQNYSMLGPGGAGGYGQERNFMYQQNPYMMQQNPMMFNQYQQLGSPYQMQNPMMMNSMMNPMMMNPMMMNPMMMPPQ